jgi:hypothetical protein
MMLRTTKIPGASPLRLVAQIDAYVLILIALVSFLDENGS